MPCFLPGAFSNYFLPLQWMKSLFFHKGLSFFRLCRSIVQSISETSDNQNNFFTNHLSHRMCKQTLWPHERRFHRIQTQSRKPPAGSNQKVPGLCRKHNLLKIIGPTCRCVIRWNMLCCSQSICDPTSVLWGWGEEVSPEGENKSIAGGKATHCYLRYAICPDIRITQEVRCDLWKVTRIVFVSACWTISRLTWNKVPLHHLLVCPPSFMNFWRIGLCCGMIKKRHTG